MSCGACKHFNGSTEAAGPCRRFPPQIAVFFRVDSGDATPLTGWPVVTASDGPCGEFSPAPICRTLKPDVLTEQREALGDAPVCHRCGRVTHGQLVDDLCDGSCEEVADA